MITHELFVEPSAVAVALPDEQVVLCHEVFGQAGLRVHSHEHPIQACERITKLLPQVVVTSAALRDEVRAMIEDRAVAVGAVLVSLDRDRPFTNVERDLAEAVKTARARLGRKPRASS